MTKRDKIRLANRVRRVRNSKKIRFDYYTADGKELSRREGYIYEVKNNKHKQPFVQMIIQGYGFKTFRIDRMRNIRSLLAK